MSQVIDEGTSTLHDDKWAQDVEATFSSEVRPVPDVGGATGEEVPVWRALPADRPGVELRLGGEQVNAPKECQHVADQVMVETLVAFIEDDPPRWEVRLKAICQCGIDLAVAREGRAPKDGSPGTVLVLTPLICETPPVPD